jgi:hypothetical protein
VTGHGAGVAWCHGEGLGLPAIEKCKGTFEDREKVSVFNVYFTLIKVI